MSKWAIGVCVAIVCGGVFATRITKKMVKESNGSNIAMIYSDTWDADYKDIVVEVAKMSTTDVVNYKETDNV